MNHTPGPWVAEDGMVFEAAERGWKICNCSDFGGNPPHQSEIERLYNAKLIAAAPDLLEACSELLEAIELGMNLTPAVKLAALALAKADVKEPAP